MELCKRWEKTVWHINKHAQVGMGVIRKNRLGSRSKLGQVQFKVRLGSRSRFGQIKGQG